jgi:Ras family
VMARAHSSFTVDSSETASSAGGSSAVSDNGILSSSSTEIGEFSEAIAEEPAGKRIFKIIVIGDSNVGKTCLTFRFCNGKFPEKTEATIGVDFREKWVDIGNEKIKVSNEIHIFNYN